MYYTIGKSLTNTVFKPYIVAADIRYGTASLEFGSYIRSSGLNTDPANIGFFAAVGTAYAMVGRKFWLIGACVLSALSAVSFVGLVGIALVIVYELLFGKAIRHRVLFLIIGAIITISAYTYYKHSSQPLITFLRDAIELKAQSKADGDQSTELRSNFIKKFPDAVSHLPSSLIIGTGYYTGVYAYYLEGVTYYGEYSGRNVPTEMENCYIEYFFDFGLIGFFFFCLFYLQILLNYQKIDRIHPSKTNKSIFAIVLGSIISFCFYHYTLYSVIMFTDVAAIVHLRNIYGKNKDSKQSRTTDIITECPSGMSKNKSIT
ncbi:MAG: O-antigen ligase family protein [Muribaculaceae bacterium]|nr:O-antigen ligase family protein [Muribaculaceae bacterium]